MSANKVVWKYILKPTDEGQTLMLPEKAELLAAAQRPEGVCIWFEVYPDQNIKGRRFEVYGTGHPIPERAVYCGTVFDTVLVWHIYEVFDWFGR